MTETYVDANLVLKSKTVDVRNNWVAEKQYLDSNSVSGPIALPPHSPSSFKWGNWGFLHML